LGVDVLLWLLGMRAGSDQQSLNLGRIYLTTGITAAYLVASIILMQKRKPGRGDLFFIRYGGILLIVVGLGAYYFMANIAQGVDVAPQ